MRYSYTDRIFCITGAAGGIGSALCRMAASQGAKIAALDRDAEGLAALHAGLPGSDHLTQVVDLTDDEAVERALQTVGATFGRIDVLINNAGMTSAERFDQRSVASIRQELSVNLISPMVVTRLAIPWLQQSDDPRILSTVSLGGIFPLGETPMYTASKFGLRGAMLALAMDLGTRGYQVGSVLPSATDTPMLWQEAIDGGNSLQFLDPPQQPADVVRAYQRMLDKPRLERYPKVSESWLVRLVMLVPQRIQTLLPLFRGRGDRGMARYLRSLQERGIATRVDDRWVLLAEGSTHHSTHRVHS